MGMRILSLSIDSIMEYPLSLKKGLRIILSTIRTPFPHTQYRVFRKYLAYYALPNLFEDSFTLHLWHARPLTKKYYRNRGQNLIYFMEYLNSSLEIDINRKFLDSSLGDYNQFIDKLMFKFTGFG